MLSVAYDAEADALYIRLLRDHPVARTAEVEDGTYADLDDEGRLIGVEIIRPAREWPIDEIVHRFAVGSDALAGVDRGFMSEFWGLRPNAASTREFWGLRPNVVSASDSRVLSPV